MSRSRYYNSRRDRAVHLLQHYFETCFRGAGLTWADDTAAEVEEIVDAILDCVDEATEAATEPLEDNRPPLTKRSPS